MHDSNKYVAFNAGPRICLGKDLAYLQMKSVVASVLLRHRLTLVPGHKVEQKMSLTLFMKHGLMVNVHPRELGAIVARAKKDMEAKLQGQECVGVKCHGVNGEAVVGVA
ncbi:unnamed protein product [Prunus armeniaca]|uniref:Cytochrome P450 n=2 Tax=Prunus TaxID=3754 RepID=A0A6J5U2Z0_PRUAR|nr:unnamed protein product [Prunus armeniaca]CAB4300377.1 unnamed protein product [Prunus armeniaca]